MDTRVKAAIASTTYNMMRVTANGYNDEADSAELLAPCKRGCLEGTGGA